MSLIIITILLGLIALSCLIYSIFAFHERGPILDNKYLLATEEERRKIARQSPEITKEDYYTTAIGFLGISALFFLFCFGCILIMINLSVKIPFTLAIIFVIALIIYCLVMRIRGGEYS